MKLPIFVIEASDVQVCETIAQAEVAVEPYDVDDPEIKGFAADGQVIGFGVVGQSEPKTTFFGKITWWPNPGTVVLEPREEWQPAELAKELRNSLRLCRPERWGIEAFTVEAADLEELIELIRKMDREKPSTKH